jgi:DNA recombination protein RmuC
MNEPSLLLIAIAGLIAGVLLGFLGTLLWARGRLGRLRLDTAGRLASAEASAESEHRRREELEAELRATAEARAELDRRLATAAAQLENAKAQIVEQQKFIETSRRDLENAFKALASAALEGNAKQFLELAEQRFGKSEAAARAELEKRKQAIEELLAPLRETLGKLSERTGQIEVAREGAYKALREQVEGLMTLTSSLQEKTTTLATALRGSQVRGRWGEIALRNVAELAGMTEHCDFEEQETLEDGGRPDMTVRLPGDRLIAVDAKAPLAAYLEACEATDEATRERALDRHVAALRQHIRTLSSREYAAGLSGDVDMVVLFLPGDPFLSAAFSRAPDLQVEALRSKVLVATPTTLVALLRTIAIYWQQRSMAENAERIADVARELYDRAAIFGEHLGKVGRGLSTAVDAYNDAVGSYERRLVPMGGKLEDMKVADGAKRRIEGSAEMVEGESIRLSEGGDPARP